MRKKNRFILPLLLIIFIFLPGFLGLNSIYHSFSQKILTNSSEITSMNEYPSPEGNPTHALEWALIWGSPYQDIAYDVAVDGSNNIYVTGQIYNLASNSFDAFLAKFDATGNLIWNITWGRQDRNETARAVRVDADLNVYIAGYSYSPPLIVDEKMFLAKFNSSGDLMWNITCGTIYIDSIYFEQSYGFDLTLDGSNIYVGGYASDSVFSQYTSLVWKYHSNGTLLQFNNEMFGGAGNSGVIYGVAFDSQHTIYSQHIIYYACSVPANPSQWEVRPYIWRSDEQLQQYAFSYSSNYDYFGDAAMLPICKTHPTGGHALAIDDCGNLYFVGSILLNEVFGETEYHLDTFIKKYDLNYQVCDTYYAQNTWYRSWGQGHTDGDNMANDICNDEIAMDVACSGDNLYIVGFIHQHWCNETALFQMDFLQCPVERPTTIFLLNYKTAGSFTWSLSWGSTNGNDQAYGVAVDSKENIYIAGYTNGSGAGMGDALLLKYGLISNNTIPGFEAVVTFFGVVAIVYIYFRRSISDKINRKHL
ncbi:MAG TPA: SBBP repeat-containing protein [Candidatus Deferrimicrobium sp.]|nr:SBBP repeat-containing protein [Candidatus Deferrimicrobium sp.]